MSLIIASIVIYLGIGLLVAIAYGIYRNDTFIIDDLDIGLMVILSIFWIIALPIILMMLLFKFIRDVIEN